ncbi:MAG TPA: NAD(P)H-dependent oxidoreductase [Longimicrobium sp.]|nr:NAD(P)H-dependent oxidoreductase [Longimicrobium sp.]
MSTVIAILGSSRSHGNTRLVLDAVLADRSVERIDLAEHRIAPYDYGHGNAGDGFLPLAEAMVRADVIVFATPVYWYSMSAQLKAFIDRMTDMTRYRKELGRAMAGKTVYLVASSTTPELPPGFEVPFQLTCDYFGMRWGGAFHGYFEADRVLSPEVARQAAGFGARVFAEG